MGTNWYKIGTRLLQTCLLGKKHTLIILEIFSVCVSCEHLLSRPAHKYRLNSLHHSLKEDTGSKKGNLLQFSQKKEKNKVTATKTCSIIFPYLFPYLPHARHPGMARLASCPVRRRKRLAPKAPRSTKATASPPWPSLERTPSRPSAALTRS